MRQAAQDPARELARVLADRLSPGMMTVNSSPPSRATSGASASCGRPHLVLAVAAGRAEPERDLLEQLVARLVAQRIVDPAEMVEVDEERGHQLAGRPRVLQRLRQTLLVGEPVRQAGQAVVVGQRLHLLQHPRVGQRHRHLVGQPAELQPLVRLRRRRRRDRPRSGCRPAAAGSGAAARRPTAAPSSENRRQVGAGAWPFGSSSSDQVRVHRAGPARPPTGDPPAPCGALVVAVVVHHAAQRLAAVGRHQRDAHQVAGKDVARAREQGVHDRRDVGRREHRPVQLGGGRRAPGTGVRAARPSR